MQPTLQTLIIQRVDRKKRCFWAKVLSEANASASSFLQCHDVSHTELTPTRGQIVEYIGGAQQVLNAQKRITGGSYRILTDQPETLPLDAVEFFRHFYSIGKVRIAKLQAAFGNDLTALDTFLANNPDAIVSSRFQELGLSVRDAELLRTGFSFNHWHRSCQNLGINAVARDRFFTIYRWNSIAVFNENPFRILAYVDTSDYRHIWKAIIDAHPNKRIEGYWAAVWVIFYEAGICYQTAISLTELQRHLADLITDTDIPTLLEAVKAEGHLYIQGEYAQLRSTLAFEAQLAYHIKRLSQATAPHSNDQITPIDWDTAFQGLKRPDVSMSILAQRCHGLESGRMLLLYGEAGTGKTHLSALILEQFIVAGWDIQVIAISNIAVSRVRNELSKRLKQSAVDACRVRYRSVARFIHEGYARSSPPTLILLDEASMIGSGQLLEVLGMIRPCDRLILSGDYRQIPPIGWGAVFHALHEREGLNRIILTEPMRQRKEGKGILDFLRDLQNGQRLRQAAAGKAASVEVIEAVGDPLSALKQYICERPNSVYDLPPIICLRRKDVAEVNTLCRHLRKEAGKRNGKELKSGFFELREGEPIINTTNREFANLWNGSRGRIVCHEERLWVEFTAQPLKRHPIHSGIQRAYAVTVHSAQGEGHQEVILYLGENIPETLLHRGSLYTAITRASHKLVIIGSPDTFDAGYRSANPAEMTNSLRLQSL